MNFKVVYGDYTSGNLVGIQTFGDYGSGYYYEMRDESGLVPGWITYIKYTNVTSLNQVDVNVQYTNTSTHIVLIQIYDWNSGSWTELQRYQGLVSWSQFNQELLVVLLILMVQ